MSIQETITKIIADNLKVEVSKINAGTSFKDDLMVDSLGQVELVMEFEKKFDITIPDEVAEKFEKVQDVLSYFESIDIDESK